MRYPEFLKANGTIGFVAPSFGCSIEPYKSAFNNAQKKLKAMGYGLDIGPNAYLGEGIGISNTPELCGKELNDSYCGDDNDVIISCGGGELMCEVVPHMDFDRIKTARPKWYMGYSDNTNFTFLNTTICDTAAIYGPHAPNFGMEPWHESITDAFDLLCGKKNVISNYKKWELESLKDEENPLLPYNVTEKFDMKTYIPGDSKLDLTSKGKEVIIEGRLIGGCIDCLVNLLGTRFDKVKEFNEKYKEDGIIWFLESCDLNNMSMRRAFWNMKEAGWFEHVRGFMIGRPLYYGHDDFGLDQYEAVLGILKSFNVPVLMDLDIGHLAPTMPMISGATAVVTAKNNSLSIEYTWK